MGADGVAGDAEFFDGTIVAARADEGGGEACFGGCQGVEPGGGRDIEGGGGGDDGEKDLARGERAAKGNEFRVAIAMEASHREGVRTKHLVQERLCFGLGCGELAEVVGGEQETAIKEVLSGGGGMKDLAGSRETKGDAANGEGAGDSGCGLER